MKCWTCGSQVNTLSFKCPACKNLKEMRKLTEIVSVKAADEAAWHGDFERELQRHFKELSGTVSVGLSKIAHAVEWGFRGLSWQVEQQTDVLRSIDDTLKSPDQTRANELRQQADEAKRLGAIPDAQELYEEALKMYRLDYRTYIGLAETLLQQNKFEAALQILERSLPYAPQGKINYKSYSLRLTGHIHACKEDYRTAAAALRKATELSPFYADAHYDYAQYCAQSGYTQRCLESLERAVDAKPLYWSLAFQEQNFDPARAHVNEWLRRVGDEAARTAREAFDELADIVQDVDRTCSSMVEEGQKYGHWQWEAANWNTQMNPLRKLRDSDDLYSHKELARLVSETTQRLRSEIKKGPLKAAEMEAQKLRGEVDRLNNEREESERLLLGGGAGVSLITGLIVWKIFEMKPAVICFILLLAASGGIYAFSKWWISGSLDEVNVQRRELSAKAIKPLKRALERMNILSPPTKTEAAEPVWIPPSTFQRRRPRGPI